MLSQKFYNAEQEEAHGFVPLLNRLTMLTDLAVVSQPNSMLQDTDTINIIEKLTALTQLQSITISGKSPDSFAQNTTAGAQGPLYCLRLFPKLLELRIRLCNANAQQVEYTQLTEWANDQLRRKVPVKLLFVNDVNNINLYYNGLEL
jgi:hypothetical protein